MPNVEAMINSIAGIDTRIRGGYVHTSLSHVSLTGTDNTLLLTAPDGHTLFLYALWVYNRNSANVNLAIGTGSSLTQRVPHLGPFLTNFSDIVPIPLAQFETDIYVTSSAGAAAASDVLVKAFAIAVGG